MISTRVGAISLSRIAAGRMNASLLSSEPRAIFLMIGSSRSAASPWTYCGVTAASSTTTPAAFIEARPAAAPTSSIDDAASFASAATSSNRPTRPPAMGPQTSGPAGPSDDDQMLTVVRSSPRMISPSKCSAARAIQASYCSAGGAGTMWVSISRLAPTRAAV